MAPSLSAQSSWTRLWIPVGSAFFLLALLVSAIVVPQLRLLHFLQAFIYIAVIVFARRDSTLAFGAGFTIAAAWNCIETFGPHLMQSGAAMIWSFLHTGKIQHLETMMVPIGGIGHLILIVACLAAAANQTTRHKWWKFAGGGAMALAYFALIIAIARPR